MEHRDVIEWKNVLRQTDTLASRSDIIRVSIQDRLQRRHCAMYRDAFSTILCRTCIPLHVHVTVG